MSLQCYSKINSTISPSLGKPCGAPNSTHPFVPCCSSGDTCMSNGLCYFTTSKLGGSGYYASGCTDAKYNAGSCPNLCNDQGRLDVVYNASSQVWSCCGGTNKAIYCSNPTKETFGAPAPADLLPYFTAGKDISVTTSTTPATASPTSTASESTGEASSGLSPGAAGGLGAGIAIVVLLLIGAVAFFGILRKRRRQRAVRDEYDPSVASTPTQETTRLHQIPLASKKASSVELHEVDGHHVLEAPPREESPSELPGSEVRDHR